MKDFFEQWENQLKQVYYILQYLQTYPDILKDLRIDNLIAPDGLFDSQIEWLWLCSKFDNAIEKEFFKPYWIPIDTSYDYFIDMSDSNFPVFEAFYDYFDDDSYRWHWEQKILFSNITRLMLAEDRGMDMKEFRVDFIWEKYGKYINEPDEKFAIQKEDNQLYYKQMGVKYEDYIKSFWHNLDDNGNPLFEKERDKQLYYHHMGGQGIISCYDCGYKEDIVSFLHGVNDAAWGYQCQGCGSFHTLNDSQRAAKSLICSCGGELSRDKPIFCPQCKSKSMGYRCTIIT